MACPLFGTKPLSEPMFIVKWTIGIKFQWNFNQNVAIVIQWQAFYIGFNMGITADLNNGKLQKSLY